MKLPDYDPTLLQLPLGDAELDQLDALLAELPGEAVMDVEALDGYLTGLLASPRLPPTETWAPLAWGRLPGEAAPFTSGKQTKRCVQLMLRHLAGLDRALRGDFPAFQPWFGIAEGADGEEAVDAQLWCSGFLVALELTAADWEGHWDLPEVAVALRPITLLGGAELEAADAALIETVAQRDEWSRQVPEAVEALVLHWHPERRADPADEDDAH